MTNTNQTTSIPADTVESLKARIAELEDSLVNALDFMQTQANHINSIAFLIDCALKTPDIYRHTEPLANAIDLTKGIALGMLLEADKAAEYSGIKLTQDEERIKRLDAYHNAVYWKSRAEME